MKKCPRKNKFLFSWTNGGQKRNANFNKRLYINKLDNSTNVLTFASIKDTKKVSDDLPTDSFIFNFLGAGHIC